MVLARRVPRTERIEDACCVDTELGVVMRRALWPRRTAPH